MLEIKKIKRKVLSKSSEKTQNFNSYQKSIFFFSSVSLKLGIMIDIWLMVHGGHFFLSFGSQVQYVDNSSKISELWWRSVLGWLIFARTFKREKIEVLERFWSEKLDLRKNYEKLRNFDPFFFSKNFLEFFLEFIF